MTNKIVIAMAAVTSLFLSLIIFKDTIAPIFQVLIYFGVVLFILVSFAVVVFAVMVNYEKLMSIRAERKEKETKAEVHSIVAPTGEVYIRELNHNAIWRAGHLQQTVYANGKYIEPSDVEREAWLIKNSPSAKIIEGQIKQLESGQQSTTFYDLLKDYPHMMLLGATNSGKTTQLACAVEYRQKQYKNPALVWLSTHSALDSHRIPSGAIIFNDPSDIAKCLKDLFTAYQGRREGGNYRHVILVLDEWPEIVDELKDLDIKAGDILRRLSRGGRKTGFSLILASHGGTVGDLDTSGHSSVKQDFAQVYLDAKLTRQGKAIWQQFDKKSSRVEITLPQLALPELSERQKEMLKLYEQGYDVKEIAEMVYKGRGGEQERRVEETISKFANSVKNF